MSNIKLSDLKGISRFIFIDGLFTKVEDKLKDSELVFTNLDNDKIQNIKEATKDDTEFLYKLISQISNVEVDIELKEFKYLVKYPSAQFAQVVQLLLEHYTNMYKDVIRVNAISFDVESNIKALGLDVE